MQTTTRTRVLSWDDIAGSEASYGDLHDEVCSALVYQVSSYYRAMGYGDADQRAYAAEMLRREELGYWTTFGENPRDIIDIQDSAVIAAHAHHIADVVFNPEADEAAAAFESINDLDNDIKHYRHTRKIEGRNAYARKDASTRQYRKAYPSGPTSSAELVWIRRALSVRVIAG